MEQIDDRVTLGGVVGGGKDSTAMALRLRELRPDVPFRFVCTPTGNEPPEMIAHWRTLEVLLGCEIEKVTAPFDLLELSRRQRLLPNARMRWCTRLTKIKPYLNFVASLRQADPALRIYSYVGLRADEPADEREGMFGRGIDEYRYPLREWNWAVGDVLRYLDSRGVTVPVRTDCALCPFQRLGEWHALWKNHPDKFAEGVGLEHEISEMTGQLVSIRSPSRDTWPARLEELGERFQAGDVPPTRTSGDKHSKCRVCSM